MDHEIKLIDNQAAIEDVHRNQRQFRHQAMATVFGIFPVHDNTTYAAQAAQAAFQLIDRLEQELSRYQPNSDISKINSLTQFQSARLSLDCFECLRDCQELYQASRGAFDISAGPLIDLWKDREDTPAAQAIQKALQLVGLPWLHLDSDACIATCMNRSITIDLGGYGKGYAVDAVKALLQEWSIAGGLIHGGQSTVCAFGKKSWPLVLRHPQKPEIVLQTIELKDQAISASGIRRRGHIIDPRSGYPVNHHLACWVITDKAARADALSTAFMVMSTAEVDAYCKQNPEIRSSLVLLHDGSLIKFE